MSALNWCSLLRQVDLQTFKSTEDFDCKQLLWQQWQQPSSARHLQLLPVAIVSGIHWAQYLQVTVVTEQIWMSQGAAGADVAHLGLHLTLKPNDVVKADCTCEP